MFYARAVKQFGNEADAAKALRVAKGTISKNLDTTRCLTFVGEKVQVHRDIAQRDAMWLTQIVGRKKNGFDALNAKRRVLIIDTIGGMEVMPARKVFAALRTALKLFEPKKASKSLFPIKSGEREIGQMQRGRMAGSITIRIADAGDIEPEVLGEAVREALAQMRR